MQAWYGSSSGNPVPPACSVPCTRSLCIAQTRKRDVELHQRGGVPTERQCPASIRRWFCSSPVERTSTAPAIPASRASPPGVLTVTSTCAPPRRGSRKPHGHLLIPAVFQDGGFCVRAEEGFQIFRHPPHGSGVLTQDQLLALGRASRSRGSAGPHFSTARRRLVKLFSPTPGTPTAFHCFIWMRNSSSAVSAGQRSTVSAAGGVTRPRASASVSEMENVPAPETWLPPGSS